MKIRLIFMALLNMQKSLGFLNIVPDISQTYLRLRSFQLKDSQLFLFHAMYPSDM